ISCLGEVIKTFSNCSTSDFGCICPNQAVQKAAGECILEHCNKREILTATRLSNTACGIVPNDDASFVPFLYTFAALTSVLVSLRFLARIQQRASIWWDDWSILGSVLVMIPWTSVCLLYRQHGGGRDIWSLTPEDVDQLLKLFWISTFFYLVSRCLTRLSIICFMLRLFSVAGSKRLIQACLVFNIALSGTFLLVITFQCQPASQFWHSWDHMHQGTCIDLWAMILSAGIFAMLFDIFIMLLPLVWIVKLQFSLAKKLVTAMMMSLGVVVIAVSVMRLVVLRRFVIDPNISATFPSVTIWAGLDLHVSLICACLPSLR
ncbi:hypothetical protein QBC37DRAFT_454484, partial [Rhypophila decipiens]